MENKFEIRKRAIKYCESLAIAKLSDEMKEVIYTAYIKGAEEYESLSKKKDLPKSKPIKRSSCDSIDDSWENTDRCGFSLPNNRC